jgi:hypothetical protein
MSTRQTLPSAEIQRAWRHAYRFSLDEYPDDEVVWERDFWRVNGAPAIAELAEDLLRERRETMFGLPGGANSTDLNALWARIDQRAALCLVRDEGLSVLAAMRLVFWTSLRGLPS